MRDEKLKQMGEWMWSGDVLPWSGEPWEPTGKTIQHSLGLIASGAITALERGWRVAQENYRHAHYREKFLEGVLQRIADKDEGLAGDIAREALENRE